jgi:glycosyltransferase involved in cell wall biosynthesis
MSKKNLLLTYCFPPFPGPESYLAAKLFANMPDSDFDVVTIEPVKSWMTKEVELFEYVSSRIASIVQISTPGWVRFIPLAKRDVVKSNSNPRIQKLSRIFWAVARPGAIILKLPDPFRVFNNSVWKDISLRAQDYETILTWSQYNSIALVGLRIKLKLGNNVKWVAYFGDPWHLNPYIPLKGITRRINKKLQNSVFNNADLLLFPTQDMADFMTKGYGVEVKDKCKVLFHSFDAKLYPGNPSLRIPMEFVLFRYIGQFYGARKAEIITQGLSTLLKRRPDLADTLKVEFIGSNTMENLDEKAVIDLPKGLVVHRSQVTYLESLGEMLTADCLISLDAPARNNIFMSAKISDYIGARKPIVALTNDGATAKLISAYGGWVAKPENPDDVANAFEQAIAHILANRGKDFGNSEVRAQLSAENVSINLLNLLANS